MNNSQLPGKAVYCLSMAIVKDCVLKVRSPDRSISLFGVVFSDVYGFLLGGFGVSNTKHTHTHTPNAKFLRCVCSFSPPCKTGSGKIWKFLV